MSHKKILMLHKPANIICQNIDAVYPCLFCTLDIDHTNKLHVEGRVDADAIGLISLFLYYLPLSQKQTL